MNTITLVEDGRPRFCVEVRPSQDAEGMIGAVAELVCHLEACLGRPVPWFDRWADDLPPVRVVLELSPQRRLGREAFAIVAGGDRVCLRASTPTAMGHAVAYFLERAFGVRWLWPGETGTVAPRADNVSWPAGTQHHAPDWQWRRLWLGGAFWMEDDPMLAELKVARVSPATLEDLHRWQRRNRLGGANIADGHRWAEICSPLDFAGTHPEYFARVDGGRAVVYEDGKHGNQPCTANPEVVRLTVDYLVAQFDARPELDGFSLSVNDGYGFCACERCSAIDDWAEADVHETSALDRTTADDIPFSSRGRSLTDRMLRFVNEVAERVAQAHPDKLLLFLIYSLYRNPPARVKLHPNVIAQFATASWSHVTPAIHGSEMDTLTGLARFAPRRGIYDYFVNGVNGSVPRGFSRVFHRCLRDYHAAGCRYFATQAGLDFATNGFAYYLAARCLWDASAGFDDLLDDYCRSGFGPAAGPVRRYIDAFLERWEGPLADASLRSGKAEPLATALYDPSWLARRRADLDAAASAAGADSAVAARVAFLASGLDFLDCFCAAARSALALVEAGAPAPGDGDWKRALADWASDDAVRAPIRAALDARRALSDWIDTHRDGFWISVMWQRYQQLGTRGLMGQWLDVVEASGTLAG